LDAISTLLPDFCNVPVKFAVASLYFAMLTFAGSKLAAVNVLSLISLPVVPSKATRRSLTADEGPVTSPDPVPEAPFSARISQ
jgi:hypothetical protein